MRVVAINLCTVSTLYTAYISCIKIYIYLYCIYLYIACTIYHERQTRAICVAWNFNANCVDFLARPKVSDQVEKDVVSLCSVCVCLFYLYVYVVYVYVDVTPCLLLLLPLLLLPLAIAFLLTLPICRSARYAHRARNESRAVRSLVF